MYVNGQFVQHTFFIVSHHFMGPSGQSTQDLHPGISSFFVFSYFLNWVVM